MSKIARKTALQFGSTAGTNQIAEYGSLANTAPVYSTDPAVIQSLPEFLEGWFSAVLAGDSPAIEDMNALDYLWSYQIGYLMQAGIAEWDSGTTYYAGSMVNSGGILYISLIDSNLGNAVTVTTAWRVKSIRQSFAYDTAWICPVGVYNVQVQSIKNAVGQAHGGFNAAPSFLINPNGTLYSWGGTNANGELGDGTVTPKSSPVLVLGGLTFTSVVVGKGTGAGVYSCYGITPSGDMYSWGFNGNGQLGLGDIVPRSSPVLVLGGFKWTKVVAISGNASGLGGQSMAIGLTTSGALYAWGASNNGGLGVGDITPRSSPVIVAGGLTWQDINLVGIDGGINTSAYGVTTAIYSPSGNTVPALYAWGANQNGQLGLGDVAFRSSPVAILGSIGLAKIYPLSSSGNGNSAFFINSSGFLYSVGQNNAGQLGDGTTTDRSSPVVIAGLTYSKIIPGGLNIYGLLANGELWSWGLNTTGQLGVGDVVSRSSAVQVLGDISWSNIVSMDDTGTALGIDTNGKLWAWGSNQNGQVGDGTVLARSSPIAVLGAPYCTQIVQAGQVTQCKNYAVDMRGNIYAWGYNIVGELGTGDNTARSSAVLVVGGRTAMNLSGITSQNVSVTPGQIYQIVVNQYYAAFGNIILGQNRCESVTISYDE